MMRTGTLAAFGIGLAALVAVAGVGHAQAPAPAAEATPPPQVVPKLTESASPPPPPAFKRAPRLVEATPPEYPAVERRAGTEGDVIVRVTVRKDGTPGEIAVVQGSGSAALDAAALAAAQTWRYEPAIGLDDQPMELQIRQRLKFRLEDSAGGGGDPAAAASNPFLLRCADVGTSVAAFLQANPGKQAREAPILQSTAGMIFLVGPGDSRKTQVQWLKSLPVAMDEILKQCADKPMSTIGDLLPAALAAARTAPVE